jgi:hypothetical protein
VRCRLSPRPRAAKTLPREGHRAPHVTGPGAAPQSRRRSDRFDSTLGFPGEGPSYVAGATQNRPRVFRGKGRHHKVISLPSQAVSLFVRTRPRAPLTQGPMGPDMPFPPSTVRRLFPSVQQEGDSLVSASTTEDSQWTRNRTSDQSPSATTTILDSPPPEGTLVGVHQMLLMDTGESTPAPLDSSKKLQTTSASSTSKTVRPRKRQKTIHQVDEPMVEEL